jgi:ribonuclease HII
MTELTVTEINAALSGAHSEELVQLIARHSGDVRPGVVALLARASRRMERERRELERLEGLACREWELADRGVAFVAGVDEVGRGALAGPVTAGAVVFGRQAMIPGLDDSKRLSPAARERIAIAIHSSAMAVSVAHAEPSEIDAIGITRATHLAMQRAIDGLPFEIDHVLVDGMPVNFTVPSTAIIRGDSSVRAIAAAAVAAKVARDALMVQLDSSYPGYGLAGNKGYGSADHLAAIETLGPSPIHRMSFSPCSQRVLF